MVRSLALALALVALLVAPCPSPASAAGGDARRAVTGPQLHQLLSVIGYLKSKLQGEEGYSSRDANARFQALLESLRLVGVSIGDARALRPDMTDAELAGALLQGQSPAHREVAIKDLSSWLGTAPQAATPADFDRAFEEPGNAPRATPQAAPSGAPLGATVPRGTALAKLARDAEAAPRQAPAGVEPDAWLPDAASAEASAAVSAAVAQALATTLRAQPAAGERERYEAERARLRAKFRATFGDRP